MKWFVMGSMGEMVRLGGMEPIVFRDGTCEEFCHELGEVICHSRMGEMVCHELYGSKGF